MKQIFLLIITLIFTISTYAQDGVKWETGTFQEALNKAQNNNNGPKYIFMDCYTAWCGPCKQMANVVFPTKKAGDYFNANFINIKMDMEKGEGPELSKKYSVKLYPTFLVLDADGNELGRVIGGISGVLGDDNQLNNRIDAFIEKIEQSKNPANSPDYLLNKYKESPDNISLAYDYLIVASSMFMNDKIVDFFTDYYDKFNIYIYTEETWKYLRSAINIDKPTVLNKILSKKENFDSRLGKSVVDNALSDILRKELISYLSGKKENASKETVNEVCNVLKYISDNDDYWKFIINASNSYSEGNTAILIKLFNAKHLSASLSPYQFATVQRIFLNMKDISMTDKIQFVKDYKEYLEEMSKGASGVLKQCENGIIPSGH